MSDEEIKDIIARAGVPFALIDARDVMFARSLSLCDKGMVERFADIMADGWSRQWEASCRTTANTQELPTFLH